MSSRLIRTRWRRRAATLTLTAAAFACVTAVLPPPALAAEATPLAASTDVTAWLPALTAVADLTHLIDAATPNSAQRDVATLNDYRTSLSAQRSTALRAALPQVDLDQALATLTAWAGGAAVALDALRVSAVQATTWVRTDAIGTVQPTDPAAVVDGLSAVATAVAAQAGAVADEVVTGLPTPADLLDTVGAAQVVLSRPLPILPTARIHAALADGDQLLIALGGQVAGVADAGAALAATGDAATELHDTLDALLAADAGGGVHVGAPEWEISAEDVTAAPAPVTHDEPPAAAPGASATATAGALTAVGDLDATGVVKGRCYTRNAEPCAPPLRWNGGAVQHHPVVYPIFWGPKWPALTGYRGDIAAMFASMNSSGFQAVLSQHYDSTGAVSATMRVGGTWVDTSSPPAVTQSGDLAAEALRAAKANRWPISTDAQFMVFLQPGSPLVSSGEQRFPCGFHTYATVGGGTSGGTKYMAYSGINFPGRTPVYDWTYGCGTVVGGTSNGLRQVASHEYAETVTDPHLDAWLDGRGQENADLCANLPVGPNGVTYLWSNDGATGGCTYGGFTPRYSYRVVTKTRPHTEPDGTYTRGHRYTSGAVAVTNTGNMPWFASGAHATRLGVVDQSSGAVDQCSPVADPPVGGSADPSRDASNPWLSCRRATMLSAGRLGVVEPAGFAPSSSTGTFGLRYKPDGSIPGGSRGTDAFRLVADGGPWMSGSAITLTRSTSNFGATAVAAATGSVGTPLLIPAGGAQTVHFAYTVARTAPWYPNEVVYLGTAGRDGHSSDLYDSATWPKSTACSRCRATVNTDTARPGQQVVFDVVLRAPTGSKWWGALITEQFRPVVDIRRNAGGLYSAYFGDPVTVTVLVLPNPLADHTVVGDAAVSAAPHEGVNDSDATNPASTGYGFRCAAAASPDATATTISGCTLTVHDAAGNPVRSYTAAPGDAATAQAAVTDPASASFDPAAGETAEVCWTANASYLDGQTRATSGCTVTGTTTTTSSTDTGA
ncbi:MAG TPA: hypothetical protein VFQ85_08215 [Mycobacteriales bacterium]|jgi:hypothetical protein|nr:hypothetical protein [Mycobacteriales bacterium]